jgi:hypothetical protein
MFISHPFVIALFTPAGCAVQAKNQQPRIRRFSAKFDATTGL